MLQPDVIIPFAGDCPHRKRALNWVTAAHLAAGRNIVIGLGNSERWCKAEAVRDALDRSQAEIIVVADCDVWADNLDEAIEAVATAIWAAPHRRVCRLNEQGTTDFLNGERTELGVSERHPAAKGGGIVILARETYEEIPIDPRFIGWGGEDQSWGYALQTLLGSPTRLRAPLYHLWHPPAARRSRSRGSYENQMLLARYFDCHNAGDVDGMRALIGEARGDRGLLHDTSNDCHADAG